METPETIHEVNKELIAVHRKLGDAGEKVATARQRKANAKRHLDLMRARKIEECRRIPNDYTSDKQRWAYAILGTEQEMIELSTAELNYAAAKDDRQLIADLRDDLQEISYNLRQHLRSLGG